MREIAVFGGGAHPALTAEICAHLAVPQRPVRLKRFANDCLEVQLQANCRERDVFIIQGSCDDCSCASRGSSVRTRRRQDCSPDGHEWARET